MLALLSYLQAAADLVLMVIDASEGWTEADGMIFSSLWGQGPGSRSCKVRGQAMLVANKSDLAGELTGGRRERPRGGAEGRREGVRQGEEGVGGRGKQAGNHSKNDECLWCGAYGTFCYGIS